MGIKRNEMPQPKWYGDDFADASTCDLFSEDRWGISVEWEILLEQAKKIDSIVLLIDKYSYHSQLFLSYIDILEANLYIFDDLFYYLVGARIGNEPNPEKFIKSGILYEISSRLFFWNLDCHNSIIQIYKQLLMIQKHIVCFLNQRDFAALRGRIAEEWSHGFYLKSHKEDSLDLAFSKDRAHRYAITAYTGKILLKPLVDQFMNALNLLENAITVFGLNYDLPNNCFPFLLKQFRKSEIGQELVKAWTRDFNGSRDSLIAKMEKDLELNKWVHRYLHLQDREEIVEKLFHDEDGCWLVDDKEYYNTRNWINILKVATLLQEYDERQKSSSTKSKKNCRRIKSFREFIKDAERTEEILDKLHRLIGNKTDTEALREIKKVMDLELLNRPTATSIRNEFPTITCSDTIVSNVLKEPKPTHPFFLNLARESFEQA